MANGSRFDQIDASSRHGLGAYAQSSDGGGGNGRLSKFSSGVLIDNGSALCYAADTGAANVYAATLTPALTLGAGDIVILKVAHANTGASTLALNGGSAIAIKKSDGVTALASGDWSAGQVVELIYDGASWQWIGGAGGGATVALQTNGSANSVQTLLDLVAGGGISLSESSGHTTITATSPTGPSGSYNVNFGILGQPLGGSVPLAFHVFTEAVSFAGNFVGSRGGVPASGVNPTLAQSWPLNKIPSGSSTSTQIGTLAVSTSGVVSFATTSGAAVSFSAGDMLVLVGSAAQDFTLSNVDAVFQGLRASVSSTPIAVVTFTWLGTIGASQVIGMYTCVNALTFVANFASAGFAKCLTNPAASWAGIVQKNGSTVGTVSSTTGGVFSFATTGGAAVTFAAGDQMTLVGPASPDASLSNLAVSLSASAGGAAQLGGDLGGTSVTPKVIGIQGVLVSATAPTSGQGLVYNSTTGLWTPAAGGSYSPAQSLTATVGTTTLLDFTSWYDSAYDLYELVWEDVVPSTTGLTLLLQCSTNGGLSWDTGANYYWSHFGWSSAGTALGGGTGKTSIQIAPFSGRTMITGAFTQNGWIRVFNPGSTNNKSFQGQFIGNDSVNSAGAQVIHVSGWYNNAFAVNGLRISISSGTFGGTFRVYKVGR